MNRYFRAAAAILIIIVFAGCAAKDIKVESINIKPKNQKDLSLPFDVRAEIVVPLGDGDKKIVVRNEFGAWALDDGLAIKTTAKEVFKKLFKEVESRGEIHDPHIIIKIKADSSIDIFWGKYKVDVQTQLLYGNGQEIGSFHVKESYDSALVNDYNALENAYRKAFLKIAKNLLKEPSKIALLKDGVNDSIVRVTDKTNFELNSKYMNITEAVVTVIVNNNDDVKQPWMSGDGKFKVHGSGYFINGDGVILTNQHVIDEAGSIIVKTPSGEELQAKVIAQDEWIDLALLKVDSNNTNYLLNYEKETNLTFGEGVIAVGSPIKTGLEHSISKGIVSSVRMIDGNRVIQTDAAINPGSSGGPLIDIDSQRVIGIITMGMRGADGIGFAIPKETIEIFLSKHQDLIDN